MKLVAFCEAGADFRLAADLIDRVLRECGPSWVADVIDTAPEAIRTYEPESSFFLIKRLAHYSRELDARVPHGHFAGEPGAADAVVGRTALAIVRALRKRGEIHAAILLRDLDNAPDRRIGLEQARNEASGWAKFRIVLGCANIMREAWVLVGFEPEPRTRHADSLTCGASSASPPPSRHTS